MNEREHAVLSLFYDEGNRELTPSFLAYRMRMSTRDATALLDGMVKHGTLDLHVDDEGHISYRLPASERHRMQRDQSRRSVSQPAQSSQAGTGSSPLRERPPPGTDATTGPAADGRHRPSSAGAGAPPHHQQVPPQQQASHPSQPRQPDSRKQRQAPHQSAVRRSSQDGTDGSVAGRTDRTWAQRLEAHHRSSSSQSDGTYEDWYAAGDDGSYSSAPQPQRSQSPHQHHRPGTRTQQRPQPGHGHHRGPTTSPMPGQFGPGEYGTLPNHQSLTPYQSGRGQLAEYRYHPRERIPILASALSLLVPGLGQFYNGEIGKGVMLLFSCLFLWIFLLFWIVWIWSVIDAYMVAEQHNNRLMNDDAPQGPPALLTDQRPPNSNAA